MSDYRNIDLAFFNAGLELNQPPERLKEIQWRRLENLGIRTEGVMEARGATDDFFSSSYFTDIGSAVTYPDDYLLGRLTYIAYVGPLADGTPGWLTVHEAQGNPDWPNHTAEDSPFYSCFLNGLPLLEAPRRKTALESGFSPYKPLMVSQHPPAITRTLTPNGLTQVVIDGRWKLYPSTINPASLSPTWRFYNDQAVGSLTQLDHVPVFALAVDIYPATTTSGPTVSASSTGVGPGTGTYEWVVTYKNKLTGARSISTGASATLTDPSGEVVVTIREPVDPQADQIELWRRGGTIANSWRLVDTLTTVGLATEDDPPVNYVYTDNKIDADIALNEALDPTLVKPFPTIDSSGDSINLLDSAEDAETPLTTFGPFLGQYTFWIGDPVKRANFYWSNLAKIELSTADLNYNTVVEPGEELVNGFVAGGNPFIWSRKKLYALDWGGPTSFPAFVPREVPIGLGLAAKWAFAVTRSGVFFLAKDGIYFTDLGAGDPTNVSSSLRPLFVGGKDDSVTLPEVDWSDENTLRLTATSRELFFFYKGQVTGEYICLRYDLAQNRWSQIRSDFSWRLAYEAESTSDYRVIFAGSTGLAYYSDDINYTSGAAEDLVCRARTFSWDAGVPTTDKEYGVLLLDLDPDGTAILCTPRYDSDTEVGDIIQITTAGQYLGRRLLTFSLGDVFKRSLSLEFEWEDSATTHPKFYQGTILFRIDEEGIVHWAHPPTALGQGGWFHIKDSYWTLKSTADVTLTVGIDGVERTYVLPSTAGVREKIYVEHLGMKGKLFSFSLDSSQPFYLYGEESGLNGKLWKTSTGYQPLNPFAAAGYAQYLRTQGGT